jgi:hypothetical protein
MSFLRALWYYLWIAPHVLQVIIVVLMIRRRWLQQFPMFFLYTAFEVLQFAILFSISRTHVGFGSGYAHAYSVGLALSTAIRFGVIQELFRHFFRRYPALEGSGRLLVRGATVVLLVLAVGLAFAAPGKGADILLNTTYVLDRTVSVLQCGLLISLFMFSRYFVLSWSSRAFGIAWGLGMFAGVELAAAVIRLHLGGFGNSSVNLITMATYHACVLIWIFYLTVAEREPRGVLKAIPEHDLDIWNRELQHLIQQ